MDYKVFAYGKDHVFHCSCSSDYIYFFDDLLDILDVCPQVCVINLDYVNPEVSEDMTFKDVCEEMKSDNVELF